MTRFTGVVLDLLTQRKIDRATAKRLLAASPEPARPETAAETRIAVIGRAIELPGARTPAEFWRVLADGRDQVDVLPEDRRGLCAPVLGEAPDFFEGAWLDGIDRFDPEFFGITPGEATVMDPQQRRFLQLAYHCFEDAGVAARIRGSRTGVYVSAADSDYLDAVPEVTPVAVPANLPSFVGSRLSHVFDLRGPACLASATCASSLVALHQAMQGLRAGDCELAVVGGITVFPFPVASPAWLMDAAGIMSGAGRSRPFAAGADGIGRGEGAVCLLLKPLDRALADGDRVHTVLLGSAMNNDGAGAALTAPNPAAHTDLLLRAWRAAGISPTSLRYLEAHGTGTEIGDPIEVRGITDAVRRETGRRQFLAIGSVKSNIGHLVDGAAGLSGLVKAMLVLENRCVPPTVHLDEPNPHIDFLDSPVFVPPRPWPLPDDGEPSRAAVSCFGFNGTNVHVVLEHPQTAPVPEEPDHDRVYPLSARTTASLRGLLAAFAEAELPDVRPGDLAHTLWCGREHFERRVCVVARDLDDFRKRCAELAASEDPAGRVSGGDGDAAAKAYLDGDASMGCRDHAGGRIVTAPGYFFDERPFWVSAPAELVPAAPRGFDLDGLLRSMGKVLGTAVGPSDTFLGAGGNSLAALQLVHALRRDFGIEVTLEQLLGMTDIAGLGAELSGQTAKDPLDGAEDHEERPGGHELSPAQLRFWFLDRIEPGEGFYHVPLVFRLRGKVDVDALRRALTELRRRHEVLRSRYPVGDDERPTMVVSDEPEVELPLLDVPAGSELAVARRIVAEPFDLERGPVWRAKLLRLGQRTHLLVLALHHIITDIESLGLLEDELRRLYPAFAAGVTPEPAAPGIGFRELTRRELAEHADGRLDELAEYWVGRVGGYTDPLVLPADRPRGAERDLSGRTLRFTLPGELTARVHEACARHGVTPFMLLLAAFQVLLQRRTGRDDLLIGTEAANRARPGADRVAGPFVNQLALRTGLGGNPAFTELLGRVRECVLGAFAHQDMPFEKLVDLVRPERSAARSPLFGVKFLFTAVSGDGFGLGDLWAEAVDIDSETAPFELTMRIFDETAASGDLRLTGSVTYQTALFDEATIRALLVEFEAVLRRALDRPDRHLSQLVAPAPAKERNRMPNAQSGPPVRPAMRRRSAVAAEPVRITRPADGNRFPVTVEPVVAGVDLAGWITANRDRVETELLANGAILFHGFGVTDVDRFHAAATAVHPRLVEYSEPSTPRGEYRDKVYVSSEYPSWYTIPLHGELSYTYEWPMKALFCCRRPASAGGETTIGDARAVLGRLSPELRAKFTEKQVMYVRNYGEGLLVPWQKVFKTDKPEDVERHCAANAPMTCEWLPDGGLRTRQVRPAVATHPVTGDEVWFNQAHIFHAYSLGAELRDQLVEQFGVDNLPVHATYGDGTPITDEELDEVYAALTACEFAAPWHAGDVLLADNMLTAHGRRSFEGDREVVVCFVEPCAAAGEVAR